MTITFDLAPNNDDNCSRTFSYECARCTMHAPCSLAGLSSCTDRRGGHGHALSGPSTSTGPSAREIADVISKTQIAVRRTLDEAGAPTWRRSVAVRS